VLANGSVVGGAAGRVVVAPAPVLTGAEVVAPPAIVVLLVLIRDESSGAVPSAEAGTDESADPMLLSVARLPPVALPPSLHDTSSAATMTDATNALRRIVFMDGRLPHGGATAKARVTATRR